MKHMVDAIEVASLLDGGDVRWLFDDTHQSLIARGAAAVNAGIDIRDVVADRTESKALLDVANSASECVCILVARA